MIGDGQPGKPADGALDDEVMLRELALALRGAADVPLRLLELGKAAFAWRTVDVELAELAFDSAREAEALSGVRAEKATLSAMTFVAPSLTIEVELTSAGLQGQLVPPRDGRLDVQLRDGGVHTTPVDVDGWFHLSPAPSALFRLHVTFADGSSVCTPWIAP